MLRIISVAVLAVTFSVTQTPPDMGAGLKHCSEIAESSRRLECYDTLAGRQKSAETTEAQGKDAEDFGAWRLTEETSPVDDSKVVYLSLVAEESTPTSPGFPLPTLFLRCKEGKLESFINWGSPVGTGTVAVTTRLDEEKAEIRKWLVSTDFRSTFFRGSQWSFIAKLKSHEKLVARLTPLARNETTAVFNLKGLSRSIGEVEAACK